ncbi:DUF2945 domain-containing protein [Pseudarthrobacter sp. S9]|uniref:DUF2945 domain-containing protein n=1 Tax=Pseudarthrobacter sp. S9 TaxID=3418421 RepID=UPI003D04693E
MTQKFKVGDQVQWNSEAGYVEGQITKVHTRDTPGRGAEENLVLLRAYLMGRGEERAGVRRRRVVSDGGRVRVSVIEASGEQFFQPVFELALPPWAGCRTLGADLPLRMMLRWAMLPTAIMDCTANISSRACQCKRPAALSAAVGVRLDSGLPRTVGAEGDGAPEQR